MSLYTPVFPPSLECRSSGLDGAPTSNKLNQPSSAEILRDIHLFLATKPEVLAPSSRPSSPSFDANVEKLKRSVFDAIDAARGDSGNGKWKQVSEKLKMGCVRGRYRMIGLNQDWHQPEDAEWILPDDEETWFKLEKDRVEARRLKGKAKQSRHPDDAPIAAVTPSRRPDMADIALPVEIDVRETISPKTMRNVKEKVAKWREAITTFEGAPGTSKTVTVASAQRIASKSGIIPKALVKNKSQSSSLGFPVVKRNIATVAGKKGEGPSNHNPLPNFPANGVQEGDDAPNGSKSVAAQERQAAHHDDGLEKASFKTPLRPVLTSDGELPKITDFPETPYIPPSFPSQLETSTPLRHDIAVPVRIKPPPIHPVPSSSSIPHPSTPRNGDQHPPCEDPFIIDLYSSPSLHSNDPQVNKRPPSPYDAAPSAAKKQRRMSPPPEGNSASPSRLAMLSVDAAEVDKSTVMPISPRGEGRLPTLTELLAASPRPKIRSRPPLEGILLVESQRAPSPRPHLAQEYPSPVKSYFSTPGSGPSDSPASAHNLLLHSPVSPMLSFAQNPDAFLPQYTSTQPGGSRHKGMSSRAFGMGYSSQFDVERHVDRVSELLEKDVDFDGWLRDVPAVEEQGDEQDH
ncbi:hypothetical protein K503DRAFT_866824 [Rhizopogon vinicolor AM-OR11-026]|uniref:Uncharacterized protein n=1 Tax=Rhizopogon vinicolor AM-OR11-026 TaxID=1314800 RepID=A0A1B7MY20_9AGAM|nr:hypothetical protein K503DRAFT_866824 [Rhizopogon vinicolor AM-OR11-026]